MSAPRIESPNDTLFDAAEAMTLEAFDCLAKGVPSVAFDDLPDWLAHAHHGLALRRVADGFVLDAPAVALLALLFAAALSEPAARHIATAGGGGRGVPLWLVQKLIPGLPPAALAASAPLRHFGLVGIEGDTLRIESRIWLREALLDRFCGAPAQETDVAARIVPLTVNGALANAVLAQGLASILASRGADLLSPAVIVDRCEVGVMAASLASIGLEPHLLAAANIPEEVEARDRLARHWSRDAALDTGVVIIAVGGRDAHVATDFADRVAGHVILIGQVGSSAFRRSVSMLGDTASAATVTDRWKQALGTERAARVGSGLLRVASQFRLDPTEIDAVCARAAGEIDAAATEKDAADALWHAAGRVPIINAVPGVSVVEPVYRWTDIVLPAPVDAALRRVEAHVRHATTVMDSWGFAERMGGRGRGVAALFAGPSGTGKTMAAEVLASSLDLRMMLIDLSQVISKYVGETSKNIAAAFAEAERSGAVMVWNEGDAIWGARGTVGNAMDRHVNAEIGDLLQRIEQFRGFTIVTTNMRQSIDPAFLRRFRFTIDFPMPAEGERLRLWQQAFPERAPVDPIAWKEFAALPLSGGSIRNVALGSAFLAAASGGRIDRGVIWAELGEELRKHKLPVPVIDWGTKQ